MADDATSHFLEGAGSSAHIPVPPMKSYSSPKATTDHSPDIPPPVFDPSHPVHLKHAVPLPQIPPMPQPHVRHSPPVPTLPTPSSLVLFPTLLGPLAALGTPSTNARFQHVRDQVQIEPPQLLLDDDIVP